MAINAEYNISNVILLESSFKREPVVNFSSENFHNNISFSIDINNKENVLNVLLNVTVNSGISESESEVTINVKMLGTFIKNAEVNEEDKRNFGRINAPAIIFPFVREHIATITSKSGIPGILLPPINFVQLANIEEV